MLVDFTCHYDKKNIFFLARHTYVYAQQCHGWLRLAASVLQSVLVACIGE